MEWPEEDVRIDVWTRGIGVEWDHTLVRATHLPTGMCTLVNTFPGQVRNRQEALRVLREIVEMTPDGETERMAE